MSTASVNWQFQINRVNLRKRETILIVMIVYNNIDNDGDGEKAQSLLTSKHLYMRSGCGYKLFEQENG